jgi:hypothetical protein
LNNRSLNIVGIDDYIGGKPDFLGAIDGFKA